MFAYKWSFYLTIVPDLKFEEFQIAIKKKIQDFWSEQAQKPTMCRGELEKEHSWKNSAFTVLLFRVAMVSFKAKRRGDAMCVPTVSCAFWRARGSRVEFVDFELRVLCQVAFYHCPPAWPGPGHTFRHQRWESSSDHGCCSSATEEAVAPREIILRFGKTKKRRHFEDNI